MDKPTILVVNPNTSQEMTAAIDPESIPSRLIVAVSCV